MVKYIFIMVIFLFVGCSETPKTESNIIDDNSLFDDAGDDMTTEHFIYNLVRDGVDGVEVEINNIEFEDLRIPVHAKSKVPIIYITEKGNCIFLENNTDSLKIISKKKSKKLERIERFIKAAKEEQ